MHHFPASIFLHLLWQDTLREQLRYDCCLNQNYNNKCHTLYFSAAELCKVQALISHIIYIFFKGSNWDVCNEEPKFSPYSRSVFIALTNPLNSHKPHLFLVFLKKNTSCYF